MLSGNSIESLSLSTISSMTLSDSAFVMSVRDIYLHDKYHTKCSHADILLKSIVDVAKSYLSISSMATADINAYSPTVHDHNTLYNKLEVEYKFGKPSKFFANESEAYFAQKNAEEHQYDINAMANDDGFKYPIHNGTATGTLSIGNMLFNGILSTVYVPLSCLQNAITIPWQVIEPTFGEIKLAAVKKKKQISPADVLNDSFDGWLWLDGQTEYQLTSFRLSSAIYDGHTAAAFVSCNDDYTSFRTYALSDFVCLSDSNAFTPINAIEVIPSHKHKVKLQSTNFTVESTGEISVSEQGPGTNPQSTVHLGNGWTIGENGFPQTKKKKVNGKTYTYHVSAISEDYKKSGSSVSEGTAYNISTICYYKGDGSSDDDWLTGYTWQDYWRQGKNGKSNFASFTSDQNFILTCSISADSLSALKPGARDIHTKDLLNGETYPSHNMMPMMVYVGRRKAIVT